MSDALGLITNVNSEDVFEHFSKVMIFPIHDEGSIEIVHKAAEGFYRYLGQLDVGKDDNASNLMEGLKNKLCIFIAGKWWHPSQCFFEPLPFATDWAVSLARSDLNISESAVHKGLDLLGIRPHPGDDDWILLLTDYADKYQGKSLQPAELNQVRYAIRLLRSATTEWLHKQEVYVPLHDGRLEVASRALVPDDPRLKNYVGTNPLPLIEDNEDVFDVARRAGAKSLRGELIERLKIQPSSTQNTKYLHLAAKLESNLQSKQFFQCLQRIAYEEAVRRSGNEVDPLESALIDQLKLPQRIHVVISPSIYVETVVEVDGEEVVVFDLESPCFLDKKNLWFWLKEGKERPIQDNTVRAICELCGLSDQLRLSRVLEADPENMSKVLDEEEVATLPGGQTLELHNPEIPILADYTDDLEDNITLEDEDTECVEPLSSEKDVGSRIFDSTFENGKTLNKYSLPIDNSKHFGSSQPIEPPTKPGHGSSNPWRDNVASKALETEGKDHHQSTTSSKTPPHGRPHAGLGHGSSQQLDSMAKNTADTTRQVRMRTYVHEKIQDDYDTGHSDSHAKALGRAGEEIVMEYEKKRKRTAKQMPPNHEGYDIESRGRDGTRYIEVKSIDGPWGNRGVGVTRAQYEAAIRLGKEWWLYVVEYVTEPPRKKVYPIANPFHLVTEFRFDSGWMGAQANELGASPVTYRPQIGASYTRESGEIVKIEGITQRGEFCRVKLRNADGILQRAIWDASWKRI
jgi:hypothetical protein